MDSQAGKLGNGTDPQAQALGATLREERTSMNRFISFAGLMAFAMMLLANFGATASADPAVSVKLSDISSYRWDGGANNARIGNQNITSIGDVNGDGRNDVAATSGSSIYVLFSPPKSGGNRLLNLTMGPEHGYRIDWLGSGNAFLANVGDQNGDGVPDMLAASFGQAMIVYGVANPSTLPNCSGSDPARCLGAETLTPAQGYKLSDPDMMSAFGGSASSAGDINGDGVDDFLVGAPGALAQKGSAYLFFGGRTAPLDGNPIDITTLPASEMIRFNGADDSDVLGAAVNSAGDVIGDSTPDLALSTGGVGLSAARTYVVDGGALPNTSPIDMATFGTGLGFTVLPPLLTAGPVVNAGDVNGDGRSDLVLGGSSFVSQSGFGAVIYGPETSPATPISAANPVAGTGYGMNPVDTNGQLGSALPNNAIANLGDLNGDGVPDQLFASPGLASGGNSGAGAAYAIFGKRPAPASALRLGPDLTGSVGIALVGSTANAKAGQTVAPAGDIDDDGLPDMFVVAPQARESGFTNSGSIYLVTGRSLIGKANTGANPQVTETTAKLEGGGVANGRESTVRFEWGTTDEYGSTTDDAPFGKSNGVRWQETEISGLTADTEYHYRVVITNDKGLSSYGQDRTFRTAKPPVDRCTLDDTQPGCSKYNHCAAVPKDCPTDPKAPRLSSLIVGTSKVSVKRGKKATVVVTLVNTGNADAKGVKFCATGPKKLVRTGGCQTQSILAQGASITKKFKITVSRKAKKGKKANVKLSAQAEGLGQKTAKVKVSIK